MNIYIIITIEYLSELIKIFSKILIRIMYRNKAVLTSKNARTYANLWKIRKKEC